MFKLLEIISANSLFEAWCVDERKRQKEYYMQRL